MVAAVGKLVETGIATLVETISTSVVRSVERVNVGVELEVVEKITLLYEVAGAEELKL